MGGKAGWEVVWVGERGDLQEVVDAGRGGHAYGVPKRDLVAPHIPQLPPELGNPLGIYRSLHPRIPTLCSCFLTHICGMQSNSIIVLSKCDLWHSKALSRHGVALVQLCLDLNDHNSSFCMFAEQRGQLIV